MFEEHDTGKLCGGYSLCLRDVAWRSLYHLLCFQHLQQLHTSLFLIAQHSTNHYFPSNGWGNLALEDRHHSEGNHLPAFFLIIIRFFSVFCVNKSIFFLQNDITKTQWWVILDELETLSHLVVDLLKPVQKTMESNVCNSPLLNRTSLPLTLSISAAKTCISHNIQNAASSRHKKQTLWCKIAAKNGWTTCDVILIPHIPRKWHSSPNYKVYKNVFDIHTRIKKIKMIVVHLYDNVFHVYRRTITKIKWY